MFGWNHCQKKLRIYMLFYIKREIYTTKNSIKEIANFNLSTLTIPFTHNFTHIKYTIF